MPRKKNSIATVQITISTTAIVRGFLETLVTTGLYGKNAAEAAERLIGRGIEQLIDQDKLKRTGARRS